jgi:hypothetical protein
MEVFSRKRCRLESWATGFCSMPNQNNTPPQHQSNATAIVGATRRLLNFLSPASGAGKPDPGRSLVKVFDIRNDAHFQGVENLPSPGDGVSVSVGSCRSQRVRPRCVWTERGRCSESPVERRGKRQERRERTGRPIPCTPPAQTRQQTSPGS